MMGQQPTTKLQDRPGDRSTAPAEHTPGPWMANGPFLWVTEEASLIEARGVDLAVERPYASDIVPVAQWEANFRLMAAAPDLLAALMGVRNAVYSMHDPNHPALVAMDAAIAKATHTEE